MKTKLVFFLAIIVYYFGCNVAKDDFQTVNIESIIHKVDYDNGTLWTPLAVNLENISVLSVYITNDTVIVKNNLGPFTKTISVSTNGIIQKVSSDSSKQVDILKISHTANNPLNVYINSNVDVIVKNKEGPFVNKLTGSISALIQKGEGESTTQVATLKTIRKDLPSLCIFVTCNKEVVVLNEVGVFTDKIYVSSSGISRKTGSDGQNLVEVFKINRDNNTNLVAHVTGDEKMADEAMKIALEPIIARISDSIRSVVGKLTNEDVKLVSELKTIQKSIIYNAENSNGNIATKLLILKEITETSMNNITGNMRESLKTEIKSALDRLKASLLHLRSTLTDFIALRLPLSFSITVL